MSKSFAQSKGARAERQVVQLLQPVVNRVYAAVGLPDEHTPLLMRNSLQSRNSESTPHFDLIGLDWIALEVKHQETLNLSQWWAQCLRQAGTSKVPVLIYKQNNIAFRVMMYGYLPAKERSVKCPVVVSMDDFLVYFENRLLLELMK